jgi:hypothetical protein
MTARDAKIVQTTGNLHHPIRNALSGEPHDIFDNPTTFDARYGVLHRNTRRGEEPIEEAITYAQCLALRLFGGWVVSTRSGS